MLEFNRTQSLIKLAKSVGIYVHTDGARLFNAAAASGRALSELAAFSDTISISLNKAIGAPFGAILAGDADFIAEALRVRQRLGGGIRPTAIVSAAALAALDSFEHIHDDHRRAKELADGLAGLAGYGIECLRPETNIAFVTIKMDLPIGDLVNRVREHGVLVLPYGTEQLRIVTHHGIDDAAVARTLSIFRTILREH